MQFFAKIGLTETAVSQRHRVGLSLFFFPDPGSCPEMTVLELGPGEPLPRRLDGRQLTRIPKNTKFSTQKRVPKRPKRIR